MTTPTDGRHAVLWVALLAGFVLCLGVSPASSQPVKVDIPTLPPGKSTTITFDATINSPFPPGVPSVSTQGQVTGRVGVTPFTVLTDDPDTPAPNDPTVTPLVQESDLAITNTNGVTSVVQGGLTTYTLGVTNNGPSAVAGATVSDALPVGLSAVTWTCTASAGSTCPASGTGAITASVALLNGNSIHGEQYPSGGHERSGHDHRQHPSDHQCAGQRQRCGR